MNGKMAETIRLKTKGRRRIGPRLLLFSVAFVGTVILGLAYWYGPGQLIAIVKDVRAKVISIAKLGSDLVLPAKRELEPTVIPSRTIQVIDGDTIRTNGLVYRLVGFDAPETIDAKCRQERALGERVTARLIAIVSRDNVELTEVRCACRPGTQGTQSWNYGRRCGLLKANGEDVGQILIREGLGRSYACGSYGCPRRQPWCAQTREEEEMEKRERPRLTQPPKVRGAGFTLIVPEDTTTGVTPRYRYRTFAECMEAQGRRGGVCINAN